MAINLRDLARGKVRLLDPQALINSLVGLDDVAAAGEKLAATIRRALGASGSGKVYRAGGREQRAAAKGKPPARQLGELEGSITVRPIQRSTGRRHRFVIRVGTRDPGAPALEFGYFRGKTGGIRPHPFFRPAYEQCKAEMITTFRIKLRARGLRSAKERGLAFRKRQQDLRADDQAIIHGQMGFE